jgi:hypothetical protein
VEVTKAYQQGERMLRTTLVITVALMGFHCTQTVCLHRITAHPIPCIAKIHENVVVAVPLPLADSSTTTSTLNLTYSKIFCNGNCRVSYSDTETDQPGDIFGCALRGPEDP